MDSVVAACRSALERPGTVIVLTGAGVSAESGIPTFRGPEGYWTVGAREYHPQELATLQSFAAMPWDVWAWYLYRRSVCRAAEPNIAHRALVDLDAKLDGRFALITVNLDGLHRRAGSPASRTFPVHGDLDMMRCAADCTIERYPIPAGVPDLAKGDTVPDAVRQLLVCPLCGEIARPHVLWFDELYCEPRWLSAIARRHVERASLLLVIGTSGSTNLPWEVVAIAQRAGATIVDINVEDTPFGEIAATSGGILRAPAATTVPALVEAITATR